SLPLKRVPATASVAPGGRAPRCAELSGMLLPPAADELAGAASCRLQPGKSNEARMMAEAPWPAMLRQRDLWRSTPGLFMPPAQRGLRKALGNGEPIRRQRLTLDTGDSLRALHAAVAAQLARAHGEAVDLAIHGHLLRGCARARECGDHVLGNGRSLVDGIHQFVPSGEGSTGGDTGIAGYGPAATHLPYLAVPAAHMVSFAGVGHGEAGLRASRHESFHAFLHRSALVGRQSLQHGLHLLLHLALLPGERCLVYLEECAFRHVHLPDAAVAHQHEITDMTVRIQRIHAELPLLGIEHRFGARFAVKIRAIHVHDSAAPRDSRGARKNQNHEASFHRSPPTGIAVRIQNFDIAALTSAFALSSFAKVLTFTSTSFLTASNFAPTPAERSHGPAFVTFSAPVRCAACVNVWPFICFAISSTLSVLVVVTVWVPADFWAVAAALAPVPSAGGRSGTCCCVVTCIC